MRYLLLLGALLGGGSGTPETLARDDYPRRAGIDIENYRFELRLSDASDVIVGRTTVSLRFTSNGVSELPLDLIGIGETGAGMSVHRVTSSGNELDWVHEADVLTIRLPEEGQRGTRLDVIVEYSGIPASGLVPGPNKYGDRPLLVVARQHEALRINRANLVPAAARRPMNARSGDEPQHILGER